jgi:hypothetical protein
MIGECPAGQDAHRLRRGAVGFCGVSDEGQSRRCGDFEDVVGKRQVAELGMAEPFGAVPVCGDVVGCPPGAELDALRGEFTDYLGNGR